MEEEGSLCHKFIKLIDAFNTWLLELGEGERESMSAYLRKWIF